MVYQDMCEDRRAGDQLRRLDGGVLHEQAFLEVRSMSHLHGMYVPSSPTYSSHSFL